MNPKDLVSVGFTANEARAYLALLELGESTASSVGKWARIPRTYAYDLLRSLEEKGFSASVNRAGKRHYSAVRPKRIRQMAATKLRYFDELVPQLEGLYQGAPARPQVQYFEGRSGMEAIHDQVLAEADEIRFFGSSAEWVASFPDWYKYAQTFVQAGITIFDLVKKSPEALKYRELYRGTKSQMRFTKADWDFGSDTVIWANKVALLSYVEHNLHGIVIESTPIYRSLLTTFEILWDLAEQE